MDDTAIELRKDHRREIPPMSVQAEQAVLGGVMISPERYIDICDKLSTADFTRAEHRDIWQAFADREEAGEPIDLVSMCGAIENASYLSELYKNTPSAANIEHYAQMVRDASLQRALLAAGSRVMEIAKGDGDIREKLDAAQSAIISITESRCDAGPKAAAEYIPGWLTALDDRVNRKGDLVGESTGLTDLDELTAGLQKTDLIILAGRPSMGKSTLAMNFAESVSIKGDGATLIFSLEMGATQLIDRTVCSIGGIDQTRLRLAQLTDGEWGRVSEASRRIKESGLIFDETAGLTVLELRARAKRVHRKTPLNLVIVDYIQLMAGKGDNQNLAVADITKGLKALAKELSVPVVALSQLNRGLEQRTDKRPRMSDLRDSGAIEQDADLIAFIYRDEAYNKDTDRPGVAEIIIAKQRNGNTGTVYAVFQGHHCRFVNSTRAYAQQKPQEEKWRGGFDS